MEWNDFSFNSGIEESKNEKYNKESPTNRSSSKDTAVYTTQTYVPGQQEWPHSVHTSTVEEFWWEVSIDRSIYQSIYTLSSSDLRL